MAWLSRTRSSRTTAPAASASTRTRAKTRSHRARSYGSAAATGADIEDRHEEIEECDFRGGRSFAAIGSFDDDSNPHSGFGWTSRLADAGVLQAAAFRRVRKPLPLF